MSMMIMNNDDHQSQDRNVAFFGAVAAVSALAPLTLSLPTPILSLSVWWYRAGPEGMDGVPSFAVLCCTCISPPACPPFPGWDGWNLFLERRQLHPPVWLCSTAVVVWVCAGRWLVGSLAEFGGVVAVWRGHSRHCHLWCVVGGLPPVPERWLHASCKGRNVVRVCGWLAGTGRRCVFLCYDRLDSVRPWGLFVTGLARPGRWWLVGRGGWVVVVLLFSSFFGHPHGVVYGWLAWG